MKADYQFLPIRKNAELGDTSLIAAGIYLALCLMSLAIALWKRRSAPTGALELPAGPVKSTVELTESEV